MEPAAKRKTEKYGTKTQYLSEWGEKRRIRQIDLVEITGIDKSLISKWWKKRNSPTKPTHIEALAKALNLADPEAIFRHPDEEWILNFFKLATREEILKAQEVLKVMFPERTPKTNA